LQRPKFSLIPSFQLNAELVLSRIAELAVRTEPAEPLTLLKDDPDNRFLELAKATKSDFLITGNSRDFQFATFYETQILNPSRYWNHYKPKD